MKMLKKCTISNKKKAISGLVFIFAAIVIYLTAKNNQWIAEYVFARGIFRIVSTAINMVTGIFPFSVVEIIVVVMPIAIIIWIIRLCVAVIKKNKVKQKMINAISNGVLFVGIIGFMYVIMCGTNYYRYTFAQINDITIEEHTDEQLYEMCMDIARRMNEVREDIEEVNGVADYNMSYLEMMESVETEFERTAKDYKCLNGYLSQAKPLSTSYIFSCFETTGIYSPFTVEAQVNIDVLDHKIPATVAHEMAHVSGFMREDEANFISYLVCSSSSDPRIVYSGLSLAYAYSVNKLYEVNTEYYYKVWDEIGEKVAGDMKANSDYWRQFEDTKLAQAGNEVNNAYLKANDQDDGTKSYGRMVDLLLSTYFQ